MRRSFDIRPELGKNIGEVIDPFVHFLTLRSRRPRVLRSPRVEVPGTGVPRRPDPIHWGPEDLLVAWGRQIARELVEHGFGAEVEDFLVGRLEGGFGTEVEDFFVRGLLRRGQ